jgi:asparagine synthase (glutamine-hydrolysing)
MVEFAFRIPAERKQSLAQGKRLLRQLAQQRLPPQLYQLPKRGFTAPIGEWIAGSHEQMFKDEVLCANSVVGNHIDIRELRRRFDAHKAGRRDHGYLLWAVWVFARWLQDHSSVVRRSEPVGRFQPVDVMPAPR